jgi:hypothetical protein
MRELSRAVQERYDYPERNRLFDTTFLWLENIRDSPELIDKRKQEVVSSMARGAQYQKVRVGPAYAQITDEAIHPGRELVGLYVHATTGLVGGPIRKPSLDSVISNPEGPKKK